MRTTTDTYTGKPFRWNMTVRVEGTLTPARIGKTFMTYLDPSRVPPALLERINRDDYDSTWENR